VGGGGVKDQRPKTGDRRDVTLVFLYFLREYSGHVPAVPGFPFLIWLALRNNNSVKATIWHRNSGFSVEAKGERGKDGK
jgi:hypothetical protein